MSNTEMNFVASEAWRSAPILPSFYPPQRTLMGPGPSDVYPRVLAAMGRPTIGHLDPEFVRMMDEIKLLLQYAFQTSNALTLPVSAPGSAGMETCFANLIEPGTKVVVCVNGVFGNRMVENVRRMGGEAIVVSDAWGQPVDVDKVAAALQAHPDAAVLAFVHAETSTGVRSDAEALCRLATENNCLSIVDTVTSLGGIEVRIDAWGADAAYSGTQKCLSCPPGLSPITLSDRAVAAIQARNAPIQSWFQDLTLVMGYWGGEGNAPRSYHHTAPVNALYGLHESLVMLAEEGLENAWQRHADQHVALRDGVEALGMEFLVDKDYRLPQLNSICVPAGVDDAALRQRLLSNNSLEIGAGLGELAGKVWRVGLMGASAVTSKVNLFLGAMRDALAD